MAVVCPHRGAGSSLLPEPAKAGGGGHGSGSAYLAGEPGVPNLGEWAPSTSLAPPRGAESGRWPFKR